MKSGCVPGLDLAPSGPSQPLRSWVVTRVMGPEEADRLSSGSVSGGLNLAPLSVLPSGRVLMFAVDTLNALKLRIAFQ